MKIKIDLENCIGCGACSAACPSGIEMIDGKPKVINESSDCHSLAADSCPVNVISIK